MNESTDPTKKYPFSQYFNKTYLVNLDRAADKFQNLTHHLENIGLEGGERFSAVYGRDLTDERLAEILGQDGVTVESLLNRMPGPTSGNRYGRIGCYLSHLAILKKARNEEHESVLILEDDAIFPQNRRAIDSFIASMEEAKGQPHDMLFLGLTHKRAPKRITPHLDRVKAASETHAYAFNKKTLDKIIDLLERPLLNPQELLIPIDERYSKYFETGEIKALSMHTLVGFQRQDAVSDITTIPKAESKQWQALKVRINGHLVVPFLEVFGLPRWKWRTRYSDLKPNQPFVRS